MNLYLKLRADRLDSAELTHLLRDLYPESDAADGELTFGRQGEAWAIRLVYSGDLLIRIDEGLGLRPADIAEIRARIDSELLRPRRPVIARSVFFSTYPVRGQLRVDDLLQLCPAPPEAPQPPFLLAEHPFIVEFPVIPSSSAWVNTTRRSMAERKVALLLNVLLDGGVRGRSSTTRHVWVLVDRGQENQVSPEYLQEGYWIAPFVGSTDDFSPVDGPAIAEVPSANYFARYGLEVDEPLNVPDIIRQLVRGFYALPQPDIERFLRAAFWYSHGQHASPHSPSAFIVAMISAIEALMEKQPEQPRCPSCGKSTGPSVTQRFVDFVEQYAPASGKLDRPRRDLYSLRSRLAHGDTLLRRDEELGPVLHDQRDWSSGLHASYTGRLVLVNWLYARCSGQAV